MHHQTLVGAAADPQYAGLENIISAVREVMAAGSATALSAEELAGPAAELRRIAAELRAVTNPEGVNRIRLRPEAAEAVRNGEPWQCHPFNAVGLPFAMRVTGETASTEFTPSALEEGPPGHLHGGHSASIIDAFLGTLVQVAVEPAFTATLDMRYLGPVVLDVPCVLTGEVTLRAGRKTIVECELSQAGRPLVTAKGLFVAVAGSGVAAVEAKAAELA